MKKLLSTIVLMFSLTSAALANTYSLDIIPSQVGEEYEFKANVGLGSFTDTWNFNVMDNSIVNGILYSTNATRNINAVLRSTGTALTDIKLFDELDNELFSLTPTIDTLTSGSFTSKTYNFVFDSLPLVPMTYKLVINGLGSSTNAQYNGYLVAANDPSNIGTPVTPVPEPESYLLMVMGLGLIGLKTHRKV